MSRSHLNQNILLPIQSVNTVNPSPDSITSNQEGNTLIWLDESLNSMNQDILKTKEMLRSVNDYILLFDDAGKCLEYIKSIDNDNILAIISGKISNAYLPLLHSLSQVKVILIFCMNENLYKPLQNDYKKIAAVCTEQEKLVDCLREIIRSFNCNASLIHLSNDKSKWRTQLNATDAYDFKKQQIIKNVILRMPRTEESKQKLVDYCRLYYKGNQSELDKIDSFDEHYQCPDHAIICYTQDSFLFRMTNNALRTQNAELLEIFHYYIIDLSRSLALESERLKKRLSTSEQKVLSLYRGHQFSNEEYEDFIKSCGYIVFNSYISTSTNIEIAKSFGGFDSNIIQAYSDSIRVLFHIHIEIDSKFLNNDDVILADISKRSHFEEECEYLFDIGATFEVINIDHEQKIIEMILSNEPQHLSETHLVYAYLRKYASAQIIDMKPGDSHLLPPHDYGELLLNIDKTLQRLDAFETYILKASIDNENYQRGSEYCLEGHLLSRNDLTLFIKHGILDPDELGVDEYTSTYNRALEYFQAFHDTCDSNDSRQWSLRVVAFAHYKIGNYQQSQKHFIKLLEMNDDPLNLATSYYFLGSIHGYLFNYTDSMNYFNKVLEMIDDIELSYIAATYCKMAWFGDQNEEQHLICALNTYEQINEELPVLKCLSELLNLGRVPHTIDNCIEILDHYLKYCQDHQIGSYIVGEAYCTLGHESFVHFNYDRALECYRKAILNSSVGESDYEILADIYIKKKDSKSAIECLEKMLELTTNLQKIVDCHSLIGREHSKLNNFDESLKYLKESVSICDQSDSDIKFYDHIFDLELERKSETTTCKSLSKSCDQKNRILYFYNKALIYSLDFLKLFQPEIICLLESVDRFLGTKYGETIILLFKENNNDHETSITRFILETSFDIYISMGDTHDKHHIFYYLKALEIHHNRQKIRIDRDTEIYAVKLIHIVGSQHKYDELVKSLHEARQIPTYQLETIETEEERQSFQKNYFLEFKRNQLAKIYSYIGDVYLKAKIFEQAELYYDKSIEYYKTFSLLFHLELADLYSKKAHAFHIQLEQQIINTDNIALNTKSSALFEKSITTIKYERDVQDD
ncbi:unnamed protein product [Adineta steineri]|uniref:Tetratricopeptide repeat protein 29 n=1 Tax=Adineta steineri TaxID=433720 RepID=A0A814NSB6_9BILA|nr:unnamed protein product [Adineta steineri]CAF3940454.1 unnamed protein product [Adineta steineri]